MQEQNETRFAAENNADNSINLNAML